MVTAHRSIQHPTVTLRDGQSFLEKVEMGQSSILCLVVESLISLKPAIRLQLSLRHQLTAQ